MSNLIGIKVYLNNINISNHVYNVNYAPEAAPEYGGIALNEINSMAGHGDFWSPLSPSSPFYAVPDLSIFPIYITLNDITIFNGFIKTINYDGSKAEVALETTLQRALDRRITYVSPADTGETPASAIMGIATQLGLPIDLATAGAVHSRQAQDNIFVFVNAAGQETALAIMEQLARISCGRLYSYRGVLRFDSYNPARTIPPLITITDNVISPFGVTLWAQPQISQLAKPASRGYKIEWVDTALPAVYREPDISITGTLNDNIQILSLQAATAIGELWLQYHQHAQYVVEIAIPPRLGEQLEVGMPIAVEFIQAGITETIIDIMEIDRSRLLPCVVRGLTR